MKKIITIIVVILGVFGAAFFALNSYIYKEKQGAGNAMEYKNATYVIEGKPVTLVDGKAEMEAAPGSASKIVTQYFGNEVVTDLNADGRDDVVFVLTQSTGGSGTFYYAVAALNTETGYQGSQALLLGDRIAPQASNKKDNGIVVIAYADRAPGEDFSTAPSVGKSIALKLDAETMQFGEVVQNFEGEADPKKMSLAMKTWVWEKAEYNDGRTIVPKQAGKFTITFGADGKFSAKTDCNSMGGSYTSSGDTLTFGPIAMTKMFCEGSQESEFAQMLENTSHYLFTSKGELVMNLKFDSGSVTFK